MLGHKSNIEHLVEQIIMNFAPQQIILFGSCARQEERETSDIDLIVIADSEIDFVQRIAFFYRILKPKVALDLLVYTPEEFNRLKNESAFVKKAIKEGVKLYEQNT